jgi:hypothetical protein
MDISRERRRDIIAALRKGTVPQRGLDFLAVGLARFEPAMASELADVAQGSSVFKAVRGDYGCGKTFFGRWVQEHAKKKGFATAEVQISETEIRCTVWRPCTAGRWSSCPRPTVSSGRSAR